MKSTPDSVAVIAFSSRKAPKVIGQVQTCATMIGPLVAVAVAPDYSFALSTCPQKIDGDNRLSAEDVVSVIGLDDPTHLRLLQVAHAGYPVGLQPDGGIITADGRYLINSNFRGAPTAKPGDGATTMLDLKTGKIVDAVEVGAFPEHVALTADSEYLVVVIGNGTSGVKTAQNFNPVFGKLSVFEVKRAKPGHVADAQLGHACQGAVWSDDGKALLVECSVERDIEMFHFDGSALTKDPDATVIFVPRPGAVATANTR